MEAVIVAQFKSPTKKLVAFFQRSRDNWKAKYVLKRDANILLANQVRAIIRCGPSEKVRQHWRELAEQAQKEVKRTQAEVRQLKEQLNKTEHRPPSN